MSLGKLVDNFLSKRISIFLLSLKLPQTDKLSPWPLVAPGCQANAKIRSVKKGINVWGGRFGLWLHHNFLINSN